MIQPRVIGFAVPLIILALIAGYQKLAHSEELGEQPLVLPIIEVYDGDTLKTQLTLPKPLDKVSIRVYGIDTPEKGGRAKCESERLAGQAATDFVTDLATRNGNRMIVTQYKYDKYGGRINGNVNIGGLDVRNSLLELGLGREYFGTGPRPNWCENEN